MFEIRKHCKHSYFFNLIYVHSVQSVIPLDVFNCSIYKSLAVLSDLSIRYPQPAILPATPDSGHIWY